MNLVMVLTGAMIAGTTDDMKPSKMRTFLEGLSIILCIAGVVTTIIVSPM